MAEIQQIDKPKIETEDAVESSEDIVKLALQGNEVKPKIKKSPEKADVSATQTLEKDNAEGSSGEIARPQKDRQVKTAEAKPEGATSKQEDMVPSWRLREIREDYERKLEEARKANEPKVEPVKVPDRETEFDAYLEHRAETLEQKLARIEEERAAEKIGQNFATSAQSYQAQNPDFNNCLNNMAHIRAKQLAELGFSQEKVEATIKLEIMKMTVEAGKLNKSPAEFIYSIGKHYPRLPEYAAATDASVAKAAPQKKEPDLTRLAEARKRNVAINGESGDSVDEYPAILNEDPVHVALGGAKKMKEWEDARDKVRKHGRI